MSVQPVCRRFYRSEDFDVAWATGTSVRRFAKRSNALAEIAYFVGGSLLRSGFRLFHNGGLPLLERRRGELIEEILFFPAPQHDGRPELPFSVRVHLSHLGVRDVRARYWRPATRAPLSIATGDIGQFDIPPALCLWNASERVATAEVIARSLEDSVLPWFETMTRPEELRVKLFEGSLPLIDFSTALELLLAEFGTTEARRFLQREPATYLTSGEIREIEGFRYHDFRVAAIAAYYRLG